MLDKRYNIPNLAKALMNYGSVGRIASFDLVKLKKLAETDEQKEIVEKVTDYCASFLEVGELMQQLDNTRPPPIFTTLGVSRTITKTLQDASLDLNTSTIRVCPREYFDILPPLKGQDS